MQPVSSVSSVSRFAIAVLACLLGIACIPLHAAGAQESGSSCLTYRTASTVAGIGLGAAIGAIPATIVHRHDQRTSHAIMAVSVSGGALTGLLLSARGHPCTSPAPASNGVRLPDPVFARRQSRAWKGALTGAVVGGILGVAGGSMMGGNGAPAYIGVEGLFGGGILGSLVGWAWPVR